MRAHPREDVGRASLPCPDRGLGTRAPGRAGEPPPALALQVFLVIDADVLPEDRDDFVLGVSSGDVWLAGVRQSDGESAGTRGHSLPLPRALVVQSPSFHCGEPPQDGGRGGRAREGLVRQRRQVGPLASSGFVWPWEGGSPTRLLLSRFSALSGMASAPPNATVFSNSVRM